MTLKNAISCVIIEWLETRAEMFEFLGFSILIATGNISDYYLFITYLVCEYYTLHSSSRLPLQH